MASKQLKIGNLLDVTFDDDGDSLAALETDGIVRVNRPPSDPNDVVRNQDAATVNDPYVLAESDSQLVNSRYLNAGNGIQINDNGAGNSIDVVAKESEIDHNSLKNYDPVEHRRWEESIAQNIHDDNISLSSVKQYEGSLSLYPDRVSSTTQPTPNIGELMIWHDSGNGKVYLLYRDTDEGIKSVELT